MKIKKYTLYIAILIILVGIFIPILGVYAAEPTLNTYEPFVANADLNRTAPQSTSSCDAVSGVGKLICQFKQILNSIIPLLVALGVVYFIWGIVQYVIADGEEAKKKGKDRMIYGIIGFAVIVGLWGLVNIIVQTFGLGSAVPPELSALTGTGGSTCSSPGPKFQDVLCYITTIINNSIIPLIFALATVMFVWGVVNFFVLNADEEKKRAQGKQFMIWGIIALAVMLSVWGLVGILGSTFNIRSTILPQVTPPH
ncbi:MAG: pilin [Candidatus Paceibacterota bacterium]